MKNKCPATRRSLLAAVSTCVVSSLVPFTFAQEYRRPRFQRIPVQYIAALADPHARSGNNAEQWGLWRKDPGPRGLPLDFYDTLRANDNVAPANWTFNDNAWWLEEHGLIMEAPEFPMPAGHYLVTGNRDITAMLTVYAQDAKGSQRWELDNDADVYDVTHLRCRSAIYTPDAAGHDCTPASALQSNFPVRPGADMPPVNGCSKQDYMVLIVYATAPLEA